MTGLVSQIRAAYERAGREPSSREEVEAFVRRLLAERNIVPSAELVAQLVDHLLDGTPVGTLQGKTIRHCGS